MHGSAGVGVEVLEIKTPQGYWSLKDPYHGPLCRRSLFQWECVSPGSASNAFNLNLFLVYCMHGFAGVGGRC